ncbi:trichohyalin-like [Drosophila obscura]|uniref:trichohyalin-like n=1 Tax=Drosophila obscura TaxID=7282 RepID=UPI001BB10183|nr:trichohyalin-like [Drosophila obscura]
MALQAAETRKRLEEEQKRAGIMEQQLKRACQEKQQSQDLLADTQVKRRSLESRLDKLREKKKAQSRCQQLEPENVRQQQYIKQLEARRATLEHSHAQLNKELLLLRNQEQEALRTVATLSEEKTRQQLRLVQMEKEWGAVKQNLATNYSQQQQKINPLINEWDALLSTKRETADALRLELDRHQDLLVAAQTEVDRLTILHAETSLEKDVLSYELQEQREQFAKLEQRLQSVQFNAEQQAKKQAKCEPENCSSAEMQMSRLQKINKRQAKILKEHYVDVDKAKLFDVELQLDDSLTLQSLCARTTTVDISTTQQSLLTGLKGNAEQLKAFIKQQEKQVKQGASSDATPTHSNMKHFG